MNPLRYYPPGKVIEFTSRTMQERFFLTPSKKINQLILGILGRAQELFPSVQVYDFVFMSNHYHMLAYSESGKDLSAFIGYLNGRIAFHLGKLIGWRGKFWSRRTRSIPILDDKALHQRFLYFRAHGVKEALVSSPKLWPGVSALPKLLKNKPLQGIWFNGQAYREAFAKKEKVKKHNFFEKKTVTLSKYPNWEHWSWKQIGEHTRRVLKTIEAEYKYKNTASNSDKKREQRIFLGAAKVCAQDPMSFPCISNHSPAPVCHASTKVVRESFRKTLRMVRDMYIQASYALRVFGEKTVEFPAYTFPPAGIFVAGEEWGIPIST